MIARGQEGYIGKRALNRYVSLNPNVFGIGIDFNKIVEDVHEKETKRPSNPTFEREGYYEAVLRISLAFGYAVVKKQCAVIAGGWFSFFCRA